MTGARRWEIDSARRAVAGVVGRPRLLEALDQRWPQLCVVRAASGSGKTTLLRNWAIARAHREPLLWVTISSEVASRAAFWTRVAEAARRAGAVDDGESAALLERVAQAPDPVAVAVEYWRAAGRATLVLDAYEKLGPVIAQVDADLVRLTAESPDLRVVVAARGSTGLVADGLRLRDRVRVLDDDDLALTAPEVAELIGVHLDRDDPALVDSVLRATRGYALAVRAMVLALSRRTAVPAPDSAGWRRLVATDLRATLADDAAARFVSLTSVPPYFDAELASRITGRGDVEATMRMLEREGFGHWIPYARNRPMFQYVDAIRDAFVADLRDSGPAFHRSADLAARWLFALGDHETAFELALTACSYPLAVQVYVDLLRVNPECYITDRLIGPLGSIPVTALRAHPMLAFALGLARLTHPMMRTSAPEAFALCVAAPPGVTGRATGSAIDEAVDRSMRAVSLRLIGRFGDAARSSRVAIAAIDRVPADDRQRFGEVIAMVLRQLSYSLLQGGAFDEAIAAMNRSATMSAVASTRNYAFAYAAGAQAFAGDLPAARAALDRIDPHGWLRGLESSYLSAMARIGEGFLQLDALDFAAAAETIASSPAYTGTTEFWPFFTTVQVLADIGLGRALSAARRVDEAMRASAPPPGVGRNTATQALQGALAIAWLIGGRTSRAERVLDAAPRHAPEVAPARMLRLLLTGRAPEAADRLSRLLALPGHTVRSRTATVALGAAAALRSGQPELAAALARRAYDAFQAHGVGAHLVLLPAEDRRALAALARRVGDAEVAARLDLVTADVVPATVPLVSVSDKELAVLAELTRTASREGIAARLGVSPNTVKTQVRSIYRKLGVSSRGEAITVATEYELLEAAGSGTSGPSIPSRRASATAAPRETTPSLR